ncbi:hypothetical protein Tco_0341288, partial [Tanacetum coccineum]
MMAFSSAKLLVADKIFSKGTLRFNAQSIDFSFRECWYRIKDILLQSLLTKSAQESRAKLIFSEICLGHKNTDDEIDDSDDSNMDLSEDEPKGDDDAAGFGVFMYNKSTEPPKS